MKRPYEEPVGIWATKPTIENFAREVADLLKFSPGDSIEELVAKTGGKLVYGSSGDGDEESGSIIAESLRKYTIYLSKNTSRQRDRFTIAHELGHLFLHFPKIIKNNKDAIMRATRRVNLHDKEKERAEWEANWFAAEFLMPESIFREKYDKGSISHVQQAFDVSESAAKVRAKSLGLDRL